MFGVLYDEEVYSALLEVSTQRSALKPRLMHNRGLFI